jgi:hypothetical protein
MKGTMLSEDHTARRRLFDCGVNRCKATLVFLQHAHRLLLPGKDFGQEVIDELHARTIEISGVARHHR